MLNYKRVSRSAAEMIVKPVQPLQQKKPDVRLDIVMTLLMGQDAKMTGSGLYNIIHELESIIHELTSQFSKRQEANHDIEQKLIKTDVSFDFSSSSMKIKKATKIAGQRRCLHRL